MSDQIREALARAVFESESPDGFPSWLEYLETFAHPPTQADVWFRRADRLLQLLGALGYTVSPVRPVDDMTIAHAALQTAAADFVQKGIEREIASRVVAAIERVLTEQALNTPLNREALISVVRTAASPEAQP